MSKVRWKCKSPFPTILVFLETELKTASVRYRYIDPLVGERTTCLIGVAVMIMVTMTMGIGAEPCHSMTTFSMYSHRQIPSIRH